MVRIKWSLTKTPNILKLNLKQKWWRLQIITKSLFYNEFLNWSYVCDILLEPMFWFVENFTACLGPFIGICSNAGYPPEGGLIPEAVSICKKCIKPKPPRTHHCSVCNRCILKMDHHCPWLNNCVGHYNHRHFFQYMVFTVLGILFIMLFGVEIAYQEFFPAQEPELDGHPVRINNSEIIPMTESLDHLSEEELAEIAKKAADTNIKEWKRRLIVFAALICVATFAALGALTWWHAGLITRGETSIEARINSTETQKYKILGKVYQNPYNFGPRQNWKLFLGIIGRNWWYILFPSTHGPYGDGLTWKTIHDTKIS
ncbi:palmitoyltransferase ZDHHC16B isoform X2 [Apis mellifera]|uniref:Palmitoyltransferase n=1 Tax=Apis mellifera TaxID=7460 RepID=A0A7M7GV41_APIME|nr:palmitoyltransferase ZDHHC16B isoform X2 [Apis mellifera]|eukprot:XP_006563511.1 palmitoyltransferase ZDHHC16B isoform X2 [Apis mellifera]